MIQNHRDPNPDSTVVTGQPGWGFTEKFLKTATLENLTSLTDIPEDKALEVLRKYQ